MLKIKHGKCRVIFFDLEFYVPEEKRSKHGFSYNPWDPTCKLLGGTFLFANPEKDFDLPESALANKTKSIWSWDSVDEKSMVTDIYLALQSALDLVHKAHDGGISPILCGIGITSSDVPIIFELIKRHGVLSNAEAFAFQNKFRVVDLSQLTLASFNHANYFLYPKSKNVILGKYLANKKFESGKTVWDLYEEKNYSGIKDRVMDEVLSTHQCYMLIKQDFDKFKALELADKRRAKELRKAQEAEL